MRFEQLKKSKGHKIISGLDGIVDDKNSIKITIPNDV